MFYRVKYPSLEFNWLPNSIRKSLSLPQMVFTDTIEFGGAYSSPSEYGSNEPCWRDDIDISRKPLIQISGLSDPKLIPGAIAHEYRHHWQKYNAPYTITDSIWSEEEDYETSIIKYFTSYEWEFDALRYQITTTPDYISEYWWDLIHDNNPIEGELST